jgi:hypothetical protein
MNTYRLEAGGTNTVPPPSLAVKILKLNYVIIPTSNRWYGRWTTPIPGGIT